MLVPREPTEEMAYAGEDEAVFNRSGAKNPAQRAANTYRAMIAATPQSMDGGLAGAEGDAPARAPETLPDAVRAAIYWLRDDGDGCLLADRLEAALAHPVLPVGDEVPYQARVRAWMLECFGEAILADKVERGFRFLEESLELSQATGISAEEAHRLVDYTFNRPVGEVAQEVGGVAVCLAALCECHGVDMDAAAEAELSRCCQIIDKIRAKHASKPKGIRTALPGDSALTPEATEPGR